MDPIAFEVIRHRLWAINDDQATMAARLSGSPIIYDAYDFNAALVTADGRGLFTGVYIMHHGATIDAFVGHILQEWDAAHIREGDMFFTNDPWWGALHANDAILAMPIFCEGHRIMWSGIVMHDNDVGSAVPGSWVTGAADRFAEAPLFPAVKIAEGFSIRRDIERMYLRNSRTAELNALNMRARVAALVSTHERVCALARQCGIDGFLEVQERIIDHVEGALVGRLAEIPDGTWFAQGYHDHDGSSGAVYRLCCRLTKSRARLVFDMTGTSPQAPGPINCTGSALRAAVSGVVLSLLCHDLPWSLGGLDRVIEIVSEPGTLNDATGSAPTSMASIAATLSTQDVVADVVARMLLTAAGQRDEAQATWSPGVCTGSFAGVNPNGEYSVTPIGNSFGGGGGARTFADGIDTGGVFHSMASRIPNVETVESRSPLLQLYRREQRDGAGPGRFRGGAGIEFAAVPHKIQGEALVNTLASGVAMPGGHGLSGGLPGTAVSNIVLRSTDVRDRFMQGRVPQFADDIAASDEHIQAAKELTPLGEHDVLVGVVGSGAGYGDPVRRCPGLVAADVRQGLVSPEMAYAVYGVACETGVVDELRTHERREAILHQRLAESRPISVDSPTPRLVGQCEVLHPVVDTVDAVRVGDKQILRCTVCDQHLGDYQDDLKRGTLLHEVPLTDVAPGNRGCRADFILRQYCCPGCGTAVATDVQHRDEPPLEGSRLFGALSR